LSEVWRWAMQLKEASWGLVVRRLFAREVYAGLLTRLRMLVARGWVAASL